MSTAFPEMLVGAGTVLTTEQVDRAVNAGKFDEDSLVIKEGKVRAIYLEQPIGGFDVHLVQK